MLFHIGRSVQGTNVPLIVRCGHFTSVFDTTLNQTVMTSTTASGGNIDYSNDGKLKTAGQYWAPYAYFCWRNGSGVPKSGGCTGPT